MTALSIDFSHSIIVRFSKKFVFQTFFPECVQNPDTFVQMSDLICLNTQQAKVLTSDMFGFQTSGFHTLFLHPNSPNERRGSASITNGLKIESITAHGGVAEG